MDQTRLPFRQGKLKGAEGAIEHLTGEIGRACAKVGHKEARVKELLTRDSPRADFWGGHDDNGDGLLGQGGGGRRLSECSTPLASARSIKSSSQAVRPPRAPARGNSEKLPSLGHANQPPLRAASAPDSPSARTRGRRRSPEPLQSGFSAGAAAAARGPAHMATSGRGAGGSTHAGADEVVGQDENYASDLRTWEGATNKGVGKGKKIPVITKHTPHPLPRQC